MIRDGGSDGSASEDDDSPDHHSEDASDSRFGKFFDRLAEREKRRDRPDHEHENESTAEGSTAENELRSGDAESSEDENAADPDGWIWGSPQESDSDRGSESATDSERITDSIDPEDDGRIWNEDADIEERVESSETKERSEEPPIDSGEAATSDESPPELGEEGDSGGPDESSPSERQNLDTPEPTEGDVDDTPPETGKRDRWAKIKASLEGSDADIDADVDESIEETVEDPDRSSAEATASVSEDRQTERGGEWSQLGSEAATETIRSSLNPSSETMGDRGDLDQAMANSSVLVLGPTGHSIADSICSRSLQGENSNRAVLFVTFDGSSEERIDICHRAETWEGGQIGIIDVGRGDRSSSASEITGGERGGSITVRHVANPGDLSKLGIVITQLLAEFDGVKGPVLCFHTLSILHQHVGTKTLFRFLNTLQGRLNAANAVGHYHMDPDLHDEIVIETLCPIFDSVVRFSAEGDLEIE